VQTQTGQKMILLLHEIVRATGVGLLIATHDFEIVNAASRVLVIEDGRVM
jgi:predicted ABC-type transport system involved in lysophospholipase L1 biosynthesis ATPase subunit